MKWSSGIKMLGFNKTYTLQFKFDIPNSAKEFLEKKTLVKSKAKYIKRYLYICLKGQNFREINNILPLNYDPYNRPMRQEKNNIFVENGALYLIKSNLLLQYQLLKFQFWSK